MPELMNLDSYPPYQAMDEATRQEFWLHMNAWSLSQFLHGEQGALLVASQLCSCAPTLSAKLYAGSQRRGPPCGGLQQVPAAAGWADVPCQHPPEGDY